MTTTMDQTLLKKPTTKVCNRCKVEKPTTEFYNRTNTDTVEPYCKDCKNAYGRARHLQIGDKVRERNNVRYAEKTYEYRARAAVRATGIPASHYICAACDETATEFHHWSYLEEHWLSVIPLCKSCHRLQHTNMLGRMLDASVINLRD